MSAAVGATIGAVPRQRRHTLHFLRGIRQSSPVFLGTTVDMSRVTEHRAEAARAGERFSPVSYVLVVAGRVLAEHPDANAAIRGTLIPRLAHYPVVNAKLALDATLAGQRVVLAAVLPDLQRATLAEVQRRVDYFRDGDPERLPELAGARALDRLPGPLGRLVFRAATTPLRRRAAAVGTFAVSSLGHRAVDGFYSVGGTTVTLGVGRIAERPVVRDATVVAAPTMRLSLVFDHRVIDGAEAADVLTEIKDGLEDFPTPEVAAPPLATGTTGEAGTTVPVAAS
ncbi:2-oxo acid dehydrogenase subunit E2 [Pseudofrankia inefficax]|uniref:Catalytic domain-containing protein of components of various dehydrogenase complexes n=1 Tax=Pseudofrankia inefficax (strain DSM 45817 / CECT 9037 / DDB 130130 / EuI1c) TaxID=298654 RepID=E3JBT9_PSEI1|nr:2-oxo acid dehydrogenase subunit E2 [Pseudofrankia inefficax]ADP82249.1 catalytic domain-containing protein of components of various dehydrogenase complexes [Pseudofrankia inefficax]